MHNNLNPQPSAKIEEIEKQLNVHCCHFDSLMPLLQLHTFDAAVYRWENSFKNINRSIWDYQGIIDGLCEGATEMENSENENENGKYNAQLAEIQRLKSTIQAMTSQVQEISRDSQDQWSKISKSPQGIPLLQFQSYSQNSLKQLHKYIEMSLALLKNQLFLKQLSISQTSNPTQDLPQRQGQKKQHRPREIDSHESQLLQNIQERMFYGLHKEIQSMRSDLPSYDIEDFHVFTFNRLTKQILEIDEILELLSVSLSQQLHFQGQQISSHYIPEINPKEKVPLSKDKYFQVQELEQKIEMINWQIRGMRKKYLHVISRMYEEAHQNENEQRANTNKKDTRQTKGSLEMKGCFDGYDVNCLQRKLANGIATLSDACLKLVGKVEDLKKQLKR